MILNQFLAELKKIRLLDKEEEILLWRGYKEDGDSECRRQLIEHYQPLVFKALSGWHLDEGTLLDVIQEGTIGLIEAVENFDHRRGVAFSLYALHRIRGRMLTYLGKEGKWDTVSVEDTVDIREYFADAAEVAHQVERSYLVAQVKDAMDRLPLKEQAVLSGMFLEDREAKQLAESMDLSLSHIYRLQKQGIRRIRGMLAKFMQNW
jgi:RNA polymerase sporulation-specific sigma factor